MNIKKLSNNLGAEKQRIAKYCVCCGDVNLKSSPAILMPFVAHRIFGWEPVVIDDSWGLHTVKNGNAYSICKSLFCSNCGFLFCDLRFYDNELSLIYHDYRGEQYNSLREIYEPGYTLRNENLNTGITYIKKVELFLEPHLTSPFTILDWGGDTGKNTPFKDRSHIFDVFDISNKDVVAGAHKVNRFQAISRKYSLIVCSNVLEHVPYPAELLLDILSSMDMDSILYIEVPLEEVVAQYQTDLHLFKKH